MVMDNLNTHGIGSLYEAFDPATTCIGITFEIHHTPKHGSWLNMAETELSVCPANAWTVASTAKTP